MSYPYHLILHLKQGIEEMEMISYVLYKTASMYEFSHIYVLIFFVDIMPENQLVFNIDLIQTQIDFTIKLHISIPIKILYFPHFLTIQTH